LTITGIAPRTTKTVAAVIPADMTAGEQGVRYIRVRLVATSATTRPPYLVGTDMVDRDLALIEQAAQGLAGGSAIRSSCDRMPSARRIDAGAGEPCRQLEAGRQMHPRLERIAIDRSDDIDWCRTSGFPARLPRSFPLSLPPVSGGGRPMRQCAAAGLSCHDRIN